MAWHDVHETETVRAHPLNILGPASSMFCPCTYYHGHRLHIFFFNSSAITLGVFDSSLCLDRIYSPGFQKGFGKVSGDMHPNGHFATKLQGTFLFVLVDRRECVCVYFSVRELYASVCMCVCFVLRGLYVQGNAWPGHDSDGM